MIRHPRGAVVVAFVWLTAGSLPARAIDLASALDRAVAEYPTLESRRESVEAARQAVRSAGAWSAPMLEAGVVNVPRGGGLDSDPMTMKMVGVTQAVPLFGAKGLERGAAREEWAAEVARADLARFQVLGLAWERYADALFERERIRESESHQGVMQRMVEAARARYASGRGRLDEVLRAEAERARARADLAGYEAAASAATARLSAVVGGAALDDSATLAPFPSVTVGERPDVWLAAVGDAHPEVRESAARADAYRLAARAARRERWPDLELHGAYGFRGRLIDGTEQDDMMSFTASVMVPLFSGWGGGPASRMEAMARGADADREGAERALVAEVRAAWVTAAAAERQVGLFADSVLVAQRRAVDASWASYGAGAADLWRVLEASHAYYQEGLALVDARHDLARAQARLVALTGRVDLLGIPMPKGERSGR